MKKIYDKMSYHNKKTYDDSNNMLYFRKKVTEYG